MARARSPNRDKAFKIYKEHEGNIDLVKIAEILNISPGTVRGWKNKDKWEDKLKGTFQKKSVKNTERSNKKTKINKETIAEEVKEVLKNTELTDKQRLFCIYYIKYFNATKAYQKAYECSYETAMVEGYRTLRNPKIESEIEKLKQHKLNQIMLSEEDIFQRYLDIAFSDIGDYLSFKKVRKNKWTKNKDGEDIPVINPDTGEQDYYEYNVVELNNSKELDTSILQEVSEGKDGVKIKLQDKMKALQWLADHIGIATDKQRAEIKVLESKIVNNEKSKEDKIDEYFNKLEECFKNAK